MDQQNIVTRRFDKNPKSYAKAYEEKTSHGYSFRSRKDRLLELLNNESGKLLDIGCGPAVMTEEIVGLGFSYDGIDIAEKMVEEAKKRMPNQNFRVGRVEKIDSAENSYNVVVAMGLVEYLDNQNDALQEIRRVLKPGGKAFISVPNWWSPNRMWDRYIISPISKLLQPFKKNKYDGVIHREYGKKEYSRILKKTGFEVIDSAYYNFRLLPRPFDFWFPSLSASTSEILEPLHKTILKFWGTGFIIVAKKK